MNVKETIPGLERPELNYQIVMSGLAQRIRDAQSRLDEQNRKLKELTRAVFSNNYESARQTDLAKGIAIELISYILEKDPDAFKEFLPNGYELKPPFNTKYPVIAEFLESRIFVKEKD